MLDLKRAYIVLRAVLINWAFISRPITLLL